MHFYGVILSSSSTFCKIDILCKWENARGIFKKILIWGENTSHSRIYLESLARYHQTLTTRLKHKIFLRVFFLFFLLFCFGIFLSRTLSRCCGLLLIQDNEHEALSYLSLFLDNFFFLPFPGLHQKLVIPKVCGLTNFSKF